MHRENVLRFGQLAHQVVEACDQLTDRDGAAEAIVGSWCCGRIHVPCLRARPPASTKSAQVYSDQRLRARFRAREELPFLVPGGDVGSVLQQHAEVEMLLVFTAV